MVANLFQSIEIMKRAMRILADRCITGITPNTAHCQKNLDAAITLVTLLNPQLGYEVLAELAMEALASDRTIRELVLERGLMPSDGKHPTAPPTQAACYPLTRNGNNSSIRLYGQTGNFSIVSFNQA